MKYDFEIKEIGMIKALEMIKTYHYSNTLPKINKKFLGFYLNDDLVGVITLGWGTRPKHTIQKIFPSLDTKDYFEIGRMCMIDKMPRNSESQMLSQLKKWLIKNEPNVKILFTFADGMLGKVGYVYQASNFKYVGYSKSEFYLKDGIKIHPRQTKALFGLKGDRRKTIRPTIEQMRAYEINHYAGKQFKYILFLCNKTERKKLIKESLINFSVPYPKEDSLSWRVKVDVGQWVNCDKPHYITDMKFRLKGGEKYKMV